MFPAGHRPIDMIEKEKLLYKIQVKGFVQGVGFRWNAAREATRLGIKGFVSNMPDGSVYIEAEGTRKQLNSYMEWCRQGPGFGYVESVTSDACPPVNYEDFRIKH